MLKKFLFITMTTLLCCTFAMGQYVAPETGKAYRILTPGKDYHCMVANYKDNLIETMAKSNNAYEQMWILEKASDKSVYIKNGLTGSYVQHISQLSGYFRMDETPKEFFIKENSYNKGFYNILCTSTESRGMHSSPFNEVVLWYSSTTAGTLSATEWVFENAGVSIDFLAEQQEKFREQQDIIKNVDIYSNKLTEFFTDRSCSELKEAYAAMSDDALREAMKEMPNVVTNTAIKVKNNAWGKREKEFRIRDYKAYANADEWHKLLQANEYSYLNNPTGIYGRANEMVYIFVEGEIKDGAMLGLYEVINTNTSGILDTLKVGLNIVPISYDLSTLFIRYEVNTHNSGKVLADYPNIKIHIENGTVNGFFEKGVHTDEDWRDITQNLATHPVIQVKGDRVLYHMEKSWITADNCCKNTITDAIGWWDNMLKWDHELLGWDKGIYGVKFNNLHCAISLDDDHTYQASTAYRTQYGVRYLYKLLPYETVQSNHDNVWGPGHELGHTHQGSIQVIGTTELSCNVFANLTMYKMGKYMSRGDTIATLSKDFAQSKPWTSMLGESRMRMWWQLYLYFHMAGNDTEFYPKLFALLREDGIDNTPEHVQGNKDILHFAEKCCEAANMDLTEYFKVWGFFQPVYQLTDKEAAWKDLTVTQAMIDKTLAKIASYSRKAPAIEFIEDRIEATPRMDGGTGNRFQSDIALGKCGDVGQFTLYNDNAPQATGYSYTKVGKTIIIEKGSGAVGFKVYNSKGEYKAMSNKLNFTIPEELATDPGLRIVAAEGDGDEVELAPYANNGADAQKAALNYALKVTDHYIKYIDKYGLRVGNYYQGKLARLSEIKDEAQAAYTNNDQSAHTFGEYLTLIDEELSNVYTSNSVISVKPLNYYTLQPKNNSSYSLDVSASAGMSVSKGGNTQNSKKWAFETDDDSLYRIKSKSGYYIASMPKNNPATITTKASEAAKFRIVSLENGYIYMELDNVHGGCVGWKSDNTIVGKEFKSQDSWWIIKRTEDNQTPYDTELLNTTIAAADSIIAELLDAQQLAGGNYAVNENILVKNSNIVELAKILIAENDNAKSILANEVTEDYGYVAEKLQTAIDAVTAAYAVIPAYPANDKNSAITWYYIKYSDSNKYLSVERTAKRYISYLMHTETLTKEETDYMLWAFVPTGNKNEYYIFNAGTGCALFGDSYLEAMGGGAAQPFTLALDTTKLSFTIGNGESFIYGTGTYPKLNAKANYYSLEKAFESDNALLAALEGEPMGRKIYGKEYADDNTMYIANSANATFIDLKEATDTRKWINKCNESLVFPNNIVFYTNLADNEATGANEVSKDGYCKQFNITPEAPYYIPEAFTAAQVTYLDANSASENIRPIVLPFVPESKLTTAAPATFGKIDGTSTLTLAYAEFAKNTPMFVIAGGESVTATATNVTVEASTKEDLATDYLLTSYVGSSYKIGTYVQGSSKYTKSTQAGTLSAFEMNIKALPGSSNTATTIVLAYDESTGIEDIEAESEKQEIYDLTGRKIEKITAPGIYIINKKKVIVREVKQ